MGEDQRKRVGADTGLVDEVQIDVSQLDPELFEGVELGFLCPPVEPVPPILDQAPNEREVRAVAPARVLDLVRPACTSEALTEIGELTLGDVEAEWRRSTHRVARTRSP